MLQLYNIVTGKLSTFKILTCCQQGPHTPFWDWGQGPLELGKIAAFC